MRRVFATFFLFLASIAFCQGQHYEDPSQVYSIVFPEKWQVWESKENGAETAHARSRAQNQEDRFLENMSVSYFLEKVQMTLEEYLQVNIKDLEAVVQDFKLEARGTGKIGPETAKWLIFSGKMLPNDKQTTFKILAYFTMLDQHPFLITCGAPSNTFDAYRQTFEGVIKSVEFSKK